MMLIIKGFVRRIGAGFDSLTDASRSAILGIAVLALLIMGWSGYRAFSTAPFEVCASSSTASLTEGDRQAFADDIPPNDSSHEEGIEVFIVVHVGGCVTSPGVYELPQGSRVSTCIDAAGGFTETANMDGVNLARIAIDGEHIIVPSVDECLHESSTMYLSQGLVNINTASTEELCRLDGIGVVLAERIIAYRIKHGGFTSIEQIKQVNGIGDGRYNAIKDDICV